MMQATDFVGIAFGLVALVALLAYSSRARRILREAFTHPFRRR